MALQGVEHSNEMLRLMMGYIPARAVYVVAKLGIADLLKGDSKTAEELSETTEADAGFLYRVLRLISGLGVLDESQDHRFTLTPLGETLCRDTENSVRDFLIQCHEGSYNFYPYLLESVMTGNNVMEKALGMPLFEYFDHNPEARGKFIAGIANQSRLDNAGILDAYDFGKSITVADIGGGSGALLSAILNKHHHLLGVLFDMETTIDSARKAGNILSERCQFLAGDFFAEIPVYANTFVLKQVLHDWNDEQSVQILKNCRASIPDDGKILIIERVVGSEVATVLTNNLDITMMLCLDGKERREDEYIALLEQSGFRLKNTIPTGLEVRILEAVPI